MLGLGRALGETMAVTFVIGNTNAFKASRSSTPATASRPRSRMNSRKHGPGLHTSADLSSD